MKRLLAPLFVGLVFLAACGSDSTPVTTGSAEDTPVVDDSASGGDDGGGGNDDVEPEPLPETVITDSDAVCLLYTSPSPRDRG